MICVTARSHLDAIVPWTSEGRSEKIIYGGTRNTGLNACESGRRCDTKEFPIPFTTSSRNARRCASKAVVLLLMLVPLSASAQQATTASDVLPQTTRLRLYHTHTGERLDVVYRRGNQYIPEALAKLDYFLRDHRTGEIHHFDPKVYDILEQLTTAVGQPGAEIDIVCGYRTPWSNEFLRSHTEGVSKNSLHMQAQAIDLRIPGVETERLRQIALSLHRGGVGYYPHSDFIHVDTGRVRQWCFECASRQPNGD